MHKRGQSSCLCIFYIEIGIKALCLAFKNELTDSVEACMLGKDCNLKNGTEDRNLFCFISARTKPVLSGLVDEVEVIEMFGGSLPAYMCRLQLFLPKQFGDKLDRIKGEAHNK